MRKEILYGGSYVEGMVLTGLVEGTSGFNVVNVIMD